jgi:hypothetical protein
MFSSAIIGCCPGQAVFVAMIGMGLGDMQAEVCFHGDSPAEVVLTVLTSRITTPTIPHEETSQEEVRIIVPEVKIPLVPIIIRLEGPADGDAEILGLGRG